MTWLVPDHRSLSSPPRCSRGCSSRCAPQPIDVDVARVVRAPLDLKVVDDGRARVRERYTVSAPVAGTLARIDLNEGDAVEPGMVLARLLPLPAPLLDPRSRQVAEEHLASAIDAQRQAEATVSRARDRGRPGASGSRASGGSGQARLPPTLAAWTRRRRTRACATRSSRRRTSPGKSPRTISSRRGRRSSASARVRARPSSSRLRRRSMARCCTYCTRARGSSRRGRRSSRSAILERWSSSSTCFRRTPSRFALGCRRACFIGGSDEPLTAKVRRVDPSAFTKTSALGVDEQRVNVVLDPDGPPDAWAPLGDGFAARDRDHGLVEARRRSGTRERALPPGRRVGGLRRDTATGPTARAVQVGHRGALQAEILGGLDGDEAVIIHPGASVREGAKVVSR